MKRLGEKIIGVWRMVVSLIVRLGWRWHTQFPEIGKDIGSAPRSLVAKGSSSWPPSMDLSSSGRVFLDDAIQKVPQRYKIIEGQHYAGAYNGLRFDLPFVNQGGGVGSLVGKCYSS